MSAERALLLNAGVVAVFGAARCAVLDLQRGRAFSLPGAFAGALRRLEQGRGRSQAALREGLDEAEQGRQEALGRFLRERGLTFETGTPERFPVLEARFEHPGLLASAVIDLAEDARHDLEELGQALRGLGAEWVGLRVVHPRPTEALARALPALSAAGLNLELQIAGWPEGELEALFALIRGAPRVYRAEVFGARDEQSHETASGFGGVRLRRGALDLARPRAPRREELHVALESYAISAEYNLFMYKSIYIDQIGRIKNGPGPGPVFGQLPGDRLEDVVRRGDFQRAWGWHKGRIAGCSTCEWRRCCADPRRPVEDAQGGLAMGGPCSYEPGAGRWRGDPGGHPG